MPSTISARYLKTSTAFSALAIACIGVLAATGAQASGDIANRDAQSRVAAENGYWTPERIMSAKPLDLGAAVDLGRAQLLLKQKTVHAPPVRGEGSAPTLRLEQPFEDRVAPDVGPAQSRPEAAPNPRATSTEGAYFTTYRIFPQAATTSYPNSTVGKLYFSDPRTGGNFSCSASVLRPRIIVTAGHCTAKPSTTAANRYFYHNYLFIPAFNRGAAPYKEWTPSQEWVTNAWYESNGAVPNTQDVGILIANDQTIGTTVTKIGSVTGWLGYETNALSDNNVTMLGYPCNLDSCTEMELTNAQTFGSGGSNTYIYGSAMSHGESGGPWLQDYGVAPTGSPAPSSPLGLNYLVAVTSYGPVATGPEYLGASELDSTFLTLLSDACNAGTGNC
jgi:V8-like Glu-specific endopeptidase